MSERKEGREGSGKGLASLSRRHFVGAAALLAAAAAGCTPDEPSKLGETGDSVTVADGRIDPEFDDALEGEWKSALCWYNCGGRCLTKAYVVDGTIMRVKTDDNKEDTLECFQQRACVRGRSMRKHLYNADRIKYPMKRKGWQPGGGAASNGALRGCDEWERIAWDEALDLVAAETKRIYDTYGPQSVLACGPGVVWDTNAFLLPRLGGFVAADYTDSYGTFLFSTMELGKEYYTGQPDLCSGNDRLDLLNAETIILYGANPAWASPGSPMYHLYRAKMAGAQFAYVGPDYNISANTLDARWIPVRPGTDTAFLLAVAYVMLTTDDPAAHPLIDWDFIGHNTVGFNAENMPTDAALDENFCDYVLGRYDGTPKTPEWASEIAGCSVDDIVWFAETNGVGKKTSLLYNYAPARCNGAEDLPQLFMTIGSMGGHFGKPGESCGLMYHFEAANAGYSLVPYGAVRDNDFVPNPCEVRIPASKLWKAIVDGEYTRLGDAERPPETQPFDIRMMWTSNSNWMTTRMNCSQAEEAVRKLEFVVAQSIWFTSTTQYSDIILPVCSEWETPLKHYQDIYLDKNNRDVLFAPSPELIEPLFESKSDRWIVSELAVRLGLDPDEIYPASEAQIMMDALAGATYLDEDGETYRTLLTLTQEDIEKWGVDNVPQEGVIGLSDLFEAGLYQVERHIGDKRGHLGFKAFVEDPQANPRPSASGKFEIYCQKKADNYNVTGLPASPIKPYPTYHRPAWGYEESFSDWEAKSKGEYPLQIFNPHYLRRAHTMFDNVPWMREAFASPLFMNSVDASERGLSDGDPALVRSAFGKTVRPVCVLDTLMPGVVALPHGAWQEFDDDGLNVGGTDNFLTGPVTDNSIVNGFNTTLVQVEKYEGQSTTSDVERPIVTPLGID